MENRAGRMEIGTSRPLGGARGGTVTGFTEDELLATIRRLLSGEAPGVRVGPGDGPKDAAVTRAGARPGDRIVVTGSLGAAAGGFQLSRAPASEMGSALTSAWGRDLLAAQFRPVARVGEGQTLAQRGASAMMDISDGLSLDLSRLCRESGVAATIRLADIPVAGGLSELVDLVHIQPMDLALSGGEDYELLATLPPSAVSQAQDQLRERFGTPLTDIGEIQEG